MTFDLLDGEPPVSFVLSTKDAERFGRFMGECQRLRAELAAKAGEVEALRAGIQKAIEEIDDAGPKALKYARQELETAIAQPSIPWVNPLAAEVSALRRLLFTVYTVPGMGYTDDGELQDSTVHPSIDFLRMTPEQIQEAIWRREAKGGRLGELAAEVEALRAASVIEWEPGRSYTAAELLRRAIRGIRGRKSRSICPAVENLFGCGNTVARYLCRWAGRDPDTGQEIAARKGEGSKS
jgi:hypothetical protein